MSEKKTRPKFNVTYKKAETVEDLERQYDKMPKFGKNKARSSNILKLLDWNDKADPEWLDKIKHLILQLLPTQLDKPYLRKEYEEQQYNKEQLDKIIPMLKQELHPNDISPHVGMSNRQIKKIRFILNDGTEDDIKLLYLCKYYISSIERLAKVRKKIELLPKKKEQKKEKIQQKIKEKKERKERLIAEGILGEDGRKLDKYERHEISLNCILCGERLGSKAERMFWLCKDCGVLLKETAIVDRYNITDSSILDEKLYLQCKNHPNNLTEPYVHKYKPSKKEKQRLRTMK
jgi:hypothetical protein